jgi:rfaE bifunctional protein kinase chain/domain
MVNKQRLQEILSRLPHLRMIVFGDYFLDNYLILDRSLSETSLETGLEAYQVIKTRKYPGVAGVVTANLRALGVEVIALGLVGDDGNGYDLRKRLVESGIDVSGFLQIPGYATPTYNKPMMREPDGEEHELNRLDVKPRAPLAASLEDRLIAEMNRALPEADGMLVVDQARSLNCGVVTDRVREELQRLAIANPGKILVADSRDFLGRYASVILKANLSEALRAAQVTRVAEESAADCADRCGRILCGRTNRPVIITLGEEGIYLREHLDRPGLVLPAIPVSGPIDIVGAGASVNAAVGAALCAGAELDEAAFLGNLVASVVIQQIGVTGTATPAQILEQYQTHFEK